jgi:uncharacterized membrane protein YdbT with pleckstrin-like domain
VAFPDRQLATDEEVVKHLHPHWLTLIIPVFVFLLTVGLGGFLLAIVPAGDMQQWLRLAIGVVGLIVLIWFVLAPVLVWKTTHYVITNQRVLIRTGVLNHTGRDIPMQRINDVAFEQTLLDRIIGAGTLQVESAGETGQTVLKNIPHSDKVQQTINHLVNEAISPDGRYGYGDPEDWPEDEQRTRRLR